MANLETWTLDAPTGGAYKSHFVSQKLFEAAVALSLFPAYAQIVDGFGKRKGETVTLPRISNLTEPSDGSLDESLSIPVDKVSPTVKTITIAEFGRAVEWTSFASDLAPEAVDIPEMYKRRLMDQMKLVLDSIVASGFKQAKVKYAPTGIASNNISTSGSFGTTALNNMNFWHMERIRDYLFLTLKAPTLQDGKYVSIFSNKSVRGLKDDPKFMQIHQYSDHMAIVKGEVGEIEGIKVVEDNHTNALSDTKGSGSVLGEGVVFGQDAVALCIALEPSLRMQQIDFGRKMAAAWYGELQAGIIWDTANSGEGRIIHVGSL